MGRKNEVGNMRAEDDLTYQEYKEGVEDAMRYIKNHGWTGVYDTRRK